MSSSVGVSSGKRQSSAYAAAAAAKQRRQKIIAGALGLVLVAVVAFELPSLLKLVRGTSSPSSPPATTTARGALPSSSAQLLKALRHKSASDPFTEAIGVNADPTPRDVGPPAGSVDPFRGSASAGGATSAPPPTSPPVTSTSPLPEKIVIGKPGGGRKASHGWIVILASIPTGEGRASATSFAGKARGRGLSPVSVLNSSNRRPLRGGYWVVYTGPYASLAAVTSRAGSVHSLGYPTAYIRELIVYR